LTGIQDFLLKSKRSLAEYPKKELSKKGIKIILINFDIKIIFFIQNYKKYYKKRNEKNKAP